MIADDVEARLDEPRRGNLYRHAAAGDIARWLAEDLGIEAGRIDDGPMVLSLDMRWLTGRQALDKLATFTRFCWWLGDGRLHFQRANVTPMPTTPDRDFTRWVKRRALAGVVPTAPALSREAAYFHAVCDDLACSFKLPVDAVVERFRRFVLLSDRPWRELYEDLYAGDELALARFKGA
jgi:hypothetical protein